MFIRQCGLLVGICGGRKLSMWIIFFFGLFIDKLLMVRLLKLIFCKLFSECRCRFLCILFWMMLNSVDGLLLWVIFECLVQCSDSFMECLVMLWLVGYGVYLLKIIMMFEFRVCCIVMDFFGFMKILVLFIGEVKVMFFFLILCMVFRLNIWKLLELVRIGFFYCMKLCRLLWCWIILVFGCNQRWKVLLRMICVLMFSMLCGNMFFIVLQVFIGMKVGVLIMLWGKVRWL